MANRNPLQRLDGNVPRPITAAKRKRTDEEDRPPGYEPPPAQRQPSSPTPTPPPSPAAASLQMLQQEFETVLSAIDPALVGPLGGSGTELKMPMQATDGRKLTWRSLARDVSIEYRISH